MPERTFTEEVVRDLNGSWQRGAARRAGLTLQDRGLCQLVETMQGWVHKIYKEAVKEYEEYADMQALEQHYETDEREDLSLDEEESWRQVMEMEHDMRWDIISDSRWMKHFLDILKKKHKKDISEDMRALARLKEAAKIAERQLSSQLETLVEVDNIVEGIDFSEKITRAAYEVICSDLSVADLSAAIEEVEQELQEERASRTRTDAMNEQLQLQLNGQQETIESMRSDAAQLTRKMGRLEEDIVAKDSTIAEGAAKEEHASG